MIDIKTDRFLYERNPSDIENSLNFAKQLPTTDLKNNIHFYWRVPRQFGRKQTLPIKSAIVHNKNKSDIFVWSNVDLSNNPYIQPLLPYIKLKIWDPIKEIEDSFLKDKIQFFKTHHLDDEMCWLGGDLFRLLCLYKYGGIYVDMDMVILRDLSPLYVYNFLYQWGASGVQPSEPNLMINGAIMAFNKENENLKHMLNTLTTIKPVPNSFCWGRDLYIASRSEDTNVFPCSWFNTEWCMEKVVLEPFKKNAFSNMMFDGAFTWHWHNKWDQEIEDGSKFFIIENIINEKFLQFLCENIV